MVRLLALALVGVPLATAAHAQPADPAQLTVRLQALQEEVARLRGEVEELRFRLRQLETAGGSAPPAAAAPPTTGAAGVPPPAGPIAGGTTLGGGPAGPGTVLDQPALPPGFDRGMALLQAGRFAEGRAELDRFVAANPNDPRAPEAAFWSADALFVAGDYEAAAAAFAANYRAYGPDAPYAADSLLKVAMALTELGDRERACLTLDELARRHANMGRGLATGVARTRAQAGCP